MKEAIVGGVLAGLVAGSIVAGAIVVTGSQGAVQVYGTVDIGNFPTEVYGGRGPILVTIADDSLGAQGPDGSQEHPFYIDASGPILVQACTENASAWEQRNGCP